MTTLLAIAAGIGALGVAVYYIAKAVRWLRGTARFVDEITGRPAEYGRKAQPGLIQKVDQIGSEQTYLRQEMANLTEALTDVKHEVFPNSGRSLRDAIDRLERREAYYHATPDQTVNVHVRPDDT